jgi:DNA-binding XRE family transcriptional regulator
MQTAAQLRAARAMAKLTRAELAQAAGVSEETVKRLETSDGRISANTSTVAALAKALEACGVVFVPENGGPAGVRFREG